MTNYIIAKGSPERFLKSEKKTRKQKTKMISFSQIQYTCRMIITTDILCIPIGNSSFGP